MNEIYMAGPWITEKEEQIVQDAIVNGWYGENAYKYVHLFETEFAHYHNRKYGLMTPNCTTALHLLLAGLGIGEGDEVIVPNCTWVGSTACVTYQRATPVFADIDPINWCLTPESISEAITPRTKAVIVVDLFGNMPEWDKILDLCLKNRIMVIEDSAEALGSIYKGTRAGKFGIGSAFSFHRTKTITTGEGGMLLLDDDQLFERCKFLRDHGRAPGTYFNSEITFKYMPFNVQAALGYAQLLRIEELVEKKRFIWQTYSELLSEIPDIILNPEPNYVKNGAWATSLIVGKSHNKKSKEVLCDLQNMDIPARPFFFPLTSLPAYPGQDAMGRKRNPVSYDISERGITLPCALNLTQIQLETIKSGIRKLLLN